MYGLSAVSWMAIAVGLFILETVTYQLICIWFSVGALVAGITAGLGGSAKTQLMAFLLTSIAVLLVGRPLLKNRLKVKKSATNADRVIGQMGVVKEEVNNQLETGRVLAGGLEWMARSVDDSVIPVDSQVSIARIEGVKLMVELQAEPALIGKE